MNFALSDEQEFLKEAARGALSRFKTVEAAREALDGGELPDLWPTAQEAGWAGLLISEEHGGAGLFVMEGMSVVLQVASFKLTGRRIFKMSPLHHHFELSGWRETKVVVRFWIIAIIFALVSLSTLKLR